MRSDRVLWQMCDSAFPAGAFAHSNGLEAVWQCGEVAGADDFVAWAEAALHQAAAGALPVLAAAWSEPDRLGEVDALWDAFLLNHVANRASRAQGRAFLMACEKSFPVEGVRQLAESVRRRRDAGHWAPLFGAACRALELPRRQACELFLFLALRGAVSSAVRLGIVGPLQGQNLQHQLSEPLDGLIDQYIDVPLEMISQVAPLADLLQGSHDRLYSRLFVS